MKKLPRILTIVFGLALALGSVHPRAVAGEAADPAAEAIMKRIIEAVKARSYDDFFVDADEKVKQAITRQMFERVSDQVGPLLREGYKSFYLGKLRQRGFTTHLWRLEVKQGKEDILCRLMIKDGRVGGVWLQ